MDDITVIKWHLDASSAVHNNMRSHPGAVLSPRKGAIQSVSCKQKISTCSLQLYWSWVSVIWRYFVVEKISYSSWRRKAMKWGTHIVFRDNQSSMKLETNGKASLGKRATELDTSISIIFWTLTWLPGTKCRYNTVQLNSWLQIAWSSL